MTLVDAYWKTIPDQMKSMMKKIVNESAYKAQMDEQLFAELDTNSDGIVTFEEWHKAITNGVLKANMGKNSL